MGDFLTNLWESVLTPGATPTLLIATNAAFAALQMLLLALLVATYSIHFAILSVLCGGLWYSINWFAAELQAAQAKEEEAERLRKKPKSRGSDWKSKGEVGDSADDEGEDTEVEDPAMRDSTASISYEPTEEDARVREEILDAMKASGRATMGGVGSGSEIAESAETARQRKAEESDRSGEVSTDSEWEKVDGSR